MPANVTHMLIAHKALQTLKAKGIEEFTQFAETLDDSSKSKNYKAYVNLGSLGPDLYYYAKMSSSVKDMLKEGFVQAKGVSPWSYHLHSYKPNEFPLKLVTILFSDVVRKDGQVELDDNDKRKLAYIAGHLVYIMLEQGEDFTDKHKRRFLKIVSDADLSCPLTQKIFEKACAALSDQRNMTVAIKTEVSDLLTKTNFLTSSRIFKTKDDKDIVNA